MEASVEAGVTNEVVKAILSRRSIRRFTGEQIRKGELETILRAAIHAPSANFAQDWHFTVIQSQSMIEQVNSWIVAEVEKSGIEHAKGIIQRCEGKVFRNAPTLIVVSCDSQNRFGIQSICAATENILIAAESLGIGSCWIGMVAFLSMGSEKERYNKELKIPDGYAIQIGVTLGYKATTDIPVPERKTDVVTYIL